MNCLTRTVKRVAIIGPVVPFRGGIAHHTTRLAEALAERAETHVFSFSRLYPSWLYPGQFQTDQTDSFSGNRTNFILDSLNPRTWRKLISTLLEIRPDFVVIPWWTFFLAPQTRYLSQQLSKLDIPVVFMCHNLVDHESRWWKATLSRWALSLGSAYIVHSRNDLKKLNEMLPEKPARWIPHPRYDRFTSSGTSKPRRSQLEILYFGFIRPYKGLDILLKSVTQLRDLDFHLSIVGEPWGQRKSYWRQRINESGLSQRIEFEPRYVDDSEIPEFFQRADVVVLPYLEATGTGVAAIALNYHRPIIGSDVGGISELVQDGQTGFLVPPNDPDALANAIIRFALSGIPQLDANIEKWAKQFEWDALAALILNLNSGEQS